MDNSLLEMLILLDHLLFFFFHFVYERLPMLLIDRYIEVNQQLKQEQEVLLEKLTHCIL